MNPSWDGPSLSLSLASSPSLPADEACPENPTAGLRRAVSHARGWLFAEQRADGGWQDVRQGSPQREASLVLLLAAVDELDTRLAGNLSRRIEQQFRPEIGGWSDTPRGPLSLETTVICYAALKQFGRWPADDVLSTARRAIRRAGGVDRCSVECLLLLAASGCLPVGVGQRLPRLLDNCRTLPPVAAAALRRCRPPAQLPAARRVQELFASPPEHWRALRNTSATGRIGQLIRSCHRQPASEQLAAELVAASQSAVDFDTLLWLALAVALLPQATPRQVWEVRQQLDGLLLDDGATAVAQHTIDRLQDTATAVAALAATGNGTPPAGLTALLQQVDSAADCSANTRATLVLALAESRQSRGDLPTRGPAPLQIAVDDEQCQPLDETSADTEVAAKIDQQARLLLAEQRADGGWRDTADGEALPAWRRFRRGVGASCPRTTAAVLAALAASDAGPPAAAIERAVAFLAAAQHSDGRWTNAAGTDTVLTTAAVLESLTTAGRCYSWVRIAGDTLEAAAAWLIAYQLPCGGWEEPEAEQASDHLRTAAVPTARETAAALTALQSGDYAAGAVLDTAAGWLIEHQRFDGAWEAACVEQDPAGPCLRRLPETCLPLVALDRLLSTQTAVPQHLR